MVAVHSQANTCDSRSFPTTSLSINVLHQAPTWESKRSTLKIVSTLSHCWNTDMSLDGTLAERNGNIHTFRLRDWVNENQGPRRPSGVTHSTQDHLFVSAVQVRSGQVSYMEARVGCFESLHFFRNCRLRS
ncbi:hypothetical protein NE237_003088 [Protea cynaroides]|uniref:Uncharacterized protein n=1 Tax=Protea cynaroides TaxID=273540 RepID=A0A9Q0QSE4_9MAGN|nr:hypothetical protein NE237_003088 [Protea cynaroides]